jgi:hypothetical protein
MKELPVDVPVTSSSRGADLPRVENMIDVQSVINRVAADVVNQMEHIAHLFNHACFMQEPTLYLDRSQFPDQEHITAFSLDEGECSVEIDCDDVEESFESKP